MQRIKLPEPITNLIVNIFANRTNQIITNFGNTESYQVHDGVDQGEMIAPILWRIYYNSLLEEIVQRVKGYGMSALIPSNVKTTIPLQQIYSILAYMDDMLWIANSKNKLEKIIEIASSFYKIAGIQVNLNKSVLVARTNE